MRIVAVALIFSVLSLAIGFVVGLGFWGLVLAWILGGQVGVAAFLTVVALIE